MNFPTTMSLVILFGNLTELAIDLFNHAGSAAL